MDIATVSVIYDAVPEFSNLGYKSYISQSLKLYSWLLWAEIDILFRLLLMNLSFMFVSIAINDFNTKILNTLQSVKCSSKFLQSLHLEWAAVMVCNSTCARQVLILAPTPSTEEIESVKKKQYCMLKEECLSLAVIYYICRILS